MVKTIYDGYTSLAQHNKNEKIQETTHGLLTQWSLTQPKKNKPT